MHADNPSCPATHMFSSVSGSILGFGYKGSDGGFWEWHSARSGVAGPAAPRATYYCVYLQNSLTFKARLCVIIIITIVHSASHTSEHLLFTERIDATIHEAYSQKVELIGVLLFVSISPSWSVFLPNQPLYCAHHPPIGRCLMRISAAEAQTQSRLRGILRG
jgi:hypothetical protein